MNTQSATHLEPLAIQGSSLGRTTAEVGGRFSAESLGGEQDFRSRMPRDISHCHLAYIISNVAVEQLITNHD